ncbi:purine-nucleoside phosphorylase [Algoriphagus machipongonensis]|uniref:Purine nucleoside phosphorylase n=1 Tax=Algoriphagus machipongonensis TaxID=388413 RepID=A3HXN2_9BACT|nr:purine-nucleoside phosphorylase [Algoriphagus machipongonensis]EAZ81355.1 purine nucleoside phosphorylase I, inosine and guanosine-specific [Algoriphagus machipongonensis]
MNYINQIKEATQFIRNLYSEPVNIGIILGTGLGKLGEQIQVDIEIDYSEIPHFPVSTVESHSGKLIFGKIGSKKVMAMKGRFHYYEGYTMQEVTFPVRVMKMLGVSNLLVSNACGGLNPSQHVGEVMIIQDHIDLFPENPLRGKHIEELGIRFPDMSDAYSPRLIELAEKIAVEQQFMFHTGVYAGVQGPNLETPAEYKYLRTIGADAVGMSTVPEVIVARQMNLEVFGISAITDLGVEGKIKKVTIAEVLEAAAMAEPIMAKIMAELIKRM